MGSPPPAFQRRSKTVDWSIVFVITIIVVAYWSTGDEQIVADLQ